MKEVFKGNSPKKKSKAKNQAAIKPKPVDLKPKKKVGKRLEE